MKSLLIGCSCLAIVTGALACDEGQSCTLAGCGTTFELAIRVADGGALPDLAYEITLGLDGEIYTVECERRPEGIECPLVDGPATYALEANFSSDGTAIAMSIVSAGGEGEGPELIDVDVVADDISLVDTIVAPEYEDVFPNGEACGPHCRHADTIAVTFARS
ncbi:MAG TPA: hypothetical protein VG755_06240 [Nannocystaceae bacterium]|nr:hypothetical protein [Nannocystaceae bacterium]